MTHIAGLVLAAGSGSRLGAPKALLVRPQTGRALVEDALCRVAAAGIAPIVVVVGAAGDRVTQQLRTRAWEVGCPSAPGVEVTIQECPQWPEGLGASLRAGLSALGQAAPSSVAALVTLVDLPDVTTQVIERVCGVVSATTQGEARTLLARAAYAGVPGHPVLLGAGHWAQVAESAHGDRGARDHLAAREVVLVECGDLATGADVDTAEAWRAMIGP